MELLPDLLTLGEGQEIRAHHRHRGPCRPQTLPFCAPLLLSLQISWLGYSAATTLCLPQTSPHGVQDGNGPAILDLPRPFSCPLQNARNFQHSTPPTLSYTPCTSGNTPTSGFTPPASDPASGRASSAWGRAPVAKKLGFQKGRLPTWWYPRSPYQRFKASFVVRDCYDN